MIRFITDFAPHLRAISRHFYADPRRVGGALRAVPDRISRPAVVSQSSARPSLLATLREAVDSNDPSFIGLTASTDDSGAAVAQRFEQCGEGGRELAAARVIQVIA